jgi:hypothetical protein
MLQGDQGHSRHLAVPQTSEIEDNAHPRAQRMVMVEMILEDLFRDIWGLIDH